MKMKKFLLCMTTALFVASTVSINAFAAEVNTVEQTQNSEAVESSVTDTDSQAGEVTTGDSTITEGTSTTGETSTTENQESDQNVAQDTTKETSDDSKSENTESKETTDSDSDKTTTTKETTTKTTTTKTTTTTKKKTSTTKKTAAKTVSTVSYSKAELRLLSSLIYCEAGGQSYAGKLAVGIVVVNRMESKAFPSTLKGVVYQKYQFGPVRNGSLSKALKEYDNNKFTSTQEKQCIKAAKAALSGVKTITYKKNGKTLKKNLSGYYYFSGRLSNPRFTLGGHQFK